MVTINISKNDFEHIERWNKHNVEKRMNTTGKFPYNEFTLKVEGDKKADFIYYTAFLETRLLLKKPQRNARLKLNIC